MTTDRFRIVEDDCCHDYLIPVGREQDWQLWLESVEAEAGEAPEWAKRIDGAHFLTFADPREER